MIYVLAYPKFENRIAGSIEKFRFENEPHRARLVRAHVTLVFGAPNVESTSFGEFCEGIAAHQPAIAVSFGQAELIFDPFEKVHKLCMLCSEGNDDLITLHRALSSGRHYSSATYQPHMTVATNESSATLSQLDIAAIGTFPLSAEIESISVVEVRSDLARDLKTIRLQG